MTGIFAAGMVTTGLLLGLLTLLSTMIWQRLPELRAAVAEGLREARREPAALHYAA